MSPGALIHVGKRHSVETKLSRIVYGVDRVEELSFDSIQALKAHESPGIQSWTNVDGLHDIAQIADIGSLYGIHNLILEDVLNTKHRPKVEEMDGLLFLSLKMLGINKKRTKVVSEQVSLVLGENWVVSFQEREGDVFEPLRDRLRENKGNLRKLGADYLFYRLVDTIVDHYFSVNDFISESIEKLEDSVLNGAEEKVLESIQSLKRTVLQMRKSIVPLREAVSTILKDEFDQIESETMRYFRDLYDHLIFVTESLETQREMLGGILDLYQTGVSNKMNQVMQVLTIIATIFIPLTFIAGIYGMNFQYMPELGWRYGYFVVMGVMAAIIVVMVLYFKKKRWL